MGEQNSQCAHAVSGDADCADGVLTLPESDDGPVYLEGRLVLSLSFQGEPLHASALQERSGPIERYVLWDDLAGERYFDGPVVLRYEGFDVVVRSCTSPVVLWEGMVNTRARVILQPDLDEAGVKANRELDLRWKRA